MRQPWHPVHPPDAPCPQCGDPVTITDEMVGYVLIFATSCASCGWHDGVVLVEPVTVP